MASPGLDAEEALRLHEDHHQPKRPAQVEFLPLVFNIKAVIVVLQSSFFQRLFAVVAFLSEFYEPNALMMEEEGAVIAGLLVGLNVIDANLCMKGEDLDSQVSYFLLNTSNGGLQMIERLCCQCYFLKCACQKVHLFVFTG